MSWENMQLARYGGPQGDFPFEEKYFYPRWKKTKWAAGSAVAEKLGTDTIKVVLAAGHPEDGSHRFKF